MEPVRVADLCSGLGGLSLGARDLNMQVVAGVDVSACALKTFVRNFPEAEAITGSVCAETTIEQCRELLKGDGRGSRIIVSGPPCQGFSAAGPRDPADPRNEVLEAVAQAIVALQPDCALIENVATVLTTPHDERRIRLSAALTKGGFHVTDVLLNASSFGVCQNRLRAFFLVTREPVSKADVMKRLQDLEAPAGQISSVLSGLPKAKPRPLKYCDETEKAEVYNHYAMRHSKEVATKIAAIPPGTGPMSYRRLHPDRVANTLFSGHRAPPAHFKEARSITVREAARLQGFPDSFRIYGSFANQMGQVTNAVPPPMAKAVLSVLAEISGIALPPR